VKTESSKEKQGIPHPIPAPITEEGRLSHGLKTPGMLLAALKNQRYGQGAHLTCLPSGI
jgi:hypothetical protein